MTIRNVFEINNKASGFGLSDLAFDPKTGALVAVRVSYDEAKRFRRGLIAWEAGTYRQIHYWEDPELSSDHRRNWSELLFSENGSRLVAVACSSTLCAVFSADDYRFLREFPICRQETYVAAPAFSTLEGEETKLLVPAWNGKLYLCDVDTLNVEEYSGFPNAKTICFAAFSSQNSGKRWLLGSYSRLESRDLTTSKTTVWERGDESSPIHCLYLKNEKKIFTLAENGATKKASKKIVLRDPTALETLEEYEVKIPGKMNAPELAYSERDNLVAVATGNSGAVFIWDVRTREIYGRIPSVGKNSYVQRLAFSPTASALAVAYDVGNAQITRVYEYER
jgi:WD40 repeat protein